MLTTTIHEEALWCIFESEYNQLKDVRFNLKTGQCERDEKMSWF